MSYHGSWWPSQAAHFAENLVLIWAPFWLGMMLWMHADPLPAAEAAFWASALAAALAEGKSIGNRAREREGVTVFHEAQLGDALDFAVHMAGGGFGLLVIYLAPFLEDLVRWLL